MVEVRNWMDIPDLLEDIAVSLTWLADERGLTDLDGSQDNALFDQFL